MRSNIFFVLLTLLLFQSCTKELEESSVDDQLQINFNTFIKEAAARNVILNLDEEQLSGYIQHIENKGIIGVCSKFESGRKELIVDEDYWSKASDLEKELLVFHELGHCILNREHLDTKDARKKCTSMMASGKGTCHIDYNSSTRSAYLDELFKN